MMKRKNNSITLKMKMRTTKTVKTMMMIYSTTMMTTYTQLSHPPLKPFSACFTILFTQRALTALKTQLLPLNVLG